MTVSSAVGNDLGVSVAGHEDNDPVTLHRIMQSMIGEGLRAHYQPPQKLSHELFVLLLQLKENERRQQRASRAPRRRTG